MYTNAEEMEKDFTEEYQKCLDVLSIDANEIVPTLYHYTNIDAGVSILENGNLRFSDIRYCNDPSEVKDGLTILENIFIQSSQKYSKLEYGQRFLNVMRYLIDSLKIETGFREDEEKLLEEMKKNFERAGVSTDGHSTLYTPQSIYICCFSGKANDLRQWIPYADHGTGMALGFEGINDNKFFVEFSNVYYIKQCYESVEKKEEYVRTFLDGAFKIFQKATHSSDLVHVFFAKVTEQLILDIIACKSPDYRDEAEYRLVAFGKHKSFQDILKFKVSNDVIKPYIEVPIIKPSLLDIKLGPKAEKVLNYEALELIKQKHAYTNASVTKSLIPFR